MATIDGDEAVKDILKSERHDLMGDGQVILFQNVKRGKLNPIWQASIRSPSSTGRMRLSTKTANLEQAKSIAREEYFKAEARVQTGLPLNPPRFDKVAKEYISWTANEHQRGRMTENMMLTHKRIIESSLMPYFENFYLHSIRTRDIERYQDQRKKIGVTGKGEAVKGSTLNRDASIINAVFKFAIREDYIKEAPLISKHHHSAQRASFSYEEMKELQSKLNKWVTQVHAFDAPHINDYRQLLKLYISIIIYSGIRPGEEMKSLHWKDVKYEQDGNQDYVLLRVITSKNKKGEKISRSVVAMPQLKETIEDFKKLHHLYNPNKHIFIHPASTQLGQAFVGAPIKTFKKQWEAFISWSGLKYEKEPPHRSRALYSLRHYYFEQRIINSDAPFVFLAKNGGTSIQVLEKWYADVKAPQGARGLAGMIEKENR